MGTWSGIKRALNSTLGTSGFKPLDKIITDLIIGQKRLVASDNVLAVIVSGSSGIGVGDTEVVGTFTPKVSGSIRLFATAKGNTSSSSSNGRIYLRNSSGTNIVNIDITASSYADYAVDTNITANETYSIVYYRGSNSNNEASSIQVRGSVIDAYTFDYTVEEV